MRHTFRFVFRALANKLSLVVLVAVATHFSKFVFQSTFQFLHFLQTFLRHFAMTIVAPQSPGEGYLSSLSPLS